MNGQATARSPRHLERVGRLWPKPPGVSVNRGVWAPWHGIRQSLRRYLLRAVYPPFDGRMAVQQPFDPSRRILIR